MPRFTEERSIEIKSVVKQPIEEKIKTEESELIKRFNELQKVEDNYGVIYILEQEVSGKVPRIIKEGEELWIFPNRKGILVREMPDIGEVRKEIDFLEETEVENFLKKCIEGLSSKIEELEKKKEECVKILSEIKEK